MYVDRDDKALIEGFTGFEAVFVFGRESGHLRKVGIWE